jgi:AraC-like DNA-binding protein
MEHVVKVARPVAALAPSVRAFAQREVALGPERLVEPVPARLEPVLEFQLGGTYRVTFQDDVQWETPAIAVVGPQTHHRAGIELSGYVESFGIFFRPAGLWRILGIPISAMTDVAYEARAVFDERIDRLWHLLAEAETFAARVRVSEEYLRRVSRDQPLRDPIAATVDRMLSSRGATAVGDLAEFAGLSVRQFERRFRNSVGMTPKYCNRMARFQSALDLRLAKPGLTWLQVAHWAGYHDQMHLVHDFHALGGMSPTRMLEEIRDQRPMAWVGDAPRPGT